jgi:hypothetical protein
MAAVKAARRIHSVLCALVFIAYPNVFPCSLPVVANLQLWQRISNPVPSGAKALANPDD